jgi:hypothetical protein
VDQDTIHYRLAQWIFQALKAWDRANESLGCGGF